jgi:hypothetical protein
MVMETKTRVEKYRKHREDISKMDTYRFDNPYAISEESEEENDIAMSDETLQREYIKKSTLSISLDKLIKAHDEYTIMISQEEIKKKKKEEQKIKLRKVRNIALISGILVLLIAIFVCLIIILLSK